MTLVRIARWFVLCGVIPMLAACDHARVEDSTSEVVRFETGARTVVEVRIDDGAIEVSRGEPGRVEVVFRKRARAADSAGAEALLESAWTDASLDGDVVRVRTRAGVSNAITVGGTVWIDVELRVPPETSALDIRTGDGSITVDSVSGTIDAETEDGRIRLSSVEGDVKLRTRDGSVTGTELGGAFDVVSDDGRIQLDGRFTRLRAVTADGSLRVTSRDGSELSDDWTLRTLDGSIEITLPETASARIDASSADGRIVNHLTRFEGSEHESRLRGTIGAGGSGGPLILITTMDGRITLRES